MTELTKLTVPNSCAALATATAPSGVMICSEPIGASITGILILWPRIVADGSTFETSTSTRGRNARLSSANRFRHMVVSDSAPPVR